MIRYMLEYLRKLEVTWEFDIPMSPDLDVLYPHEFAKVIAWDDYVNPRQALDSDEDI